MIEIEIAPSLADTKNGNMTGTLWEKYNQTFEPLARVAANRHLMTWEEFAPWSTNPLCLKYLAYNHTSAGSALVGMGTQTNHLEEWPLISLPFFEARWPDLYEQRLIWYVGFVGVIGRQPRAFRELLRAMSAPARRCGGITGMDFCAYNTTERRLPGASRNILRDFAPSMTLTKVDAQEFWVADFTADHALQIAPPETPEAP